jgi:hypothetical protein
LAPIHTSSGRQLFLLAYHHSHYYFLCRKRKPRLNRTKGWFPKEPSAQSAEAQDGGPSAPPDEDGGPSSPPRMHKKAIMKKLAPKKKNIGQ